MTARGVSSQVTFRAVEEAHPGGRWQELLRRFWPAYERWFLRHGDAARPSLGAAQVALRRHMPELVPVYERLVELAGGDPLVARFLPLYNPTPYLTGCSQAVWSRQGRPLLVRNYDYAPHLWEAVLLKTTWSGVDVLAMGDCLWGALDGVNSRGLAAALSFGGRRVVGDGFGIPLVLRYLLECCRSVTEVLGVLHRLPSHMAYNVTALDAGGDFVTVQLAPDHPPAILRSPIATNHQQVRDWEEYTRATASLERERHLATMLADDGLDAESLVEAFLQPPLRSLAYGRGFGTLYTAVYDPLAGSVELRWPGRRICQRLDEFTPGEMALSVAVEPPHPPLAERPQSADPDRLDVDPLV